MGLVVLSIAGHWASSSVCSGQTFAGVSLRVGSLCVADATYLMHSRRLPALAAAGPSDGTPPAEERNAFSELYDRWNTRGGAVLVTFLGIIAGWLFEKALELVGVESMTAGIWTSGVFFVGLLFWTFQYITRVMTKSTTYAEQLANYEQEVMLKRLKELEEDEIAALCEEVGISQDDISGAVGDKLKALSQKEKIIQLFKNTKMPKDPRTILNT